MLSPFHHSHLRARPSTGAGIRRHGPGVALIAMLLIGLIKIATAAQLPNPTCAPRSTSAVVPLHYHIPAAVNTAQMLSPVPDSQVVNMAIILPLRNPSGLHHLLNRLYNPVDPIYGHYLTPSQFAAQFGPSQQDYDSVSSFAMSSGFMVTNTHSNRAILDVSGSARAVENTFGVRLINYRASNGRTFFAPDSVPRIPGSIANIITGVVGLDNATQLRPQFHVIPRTGINPLQIGTGPEGALAPSDIKTAYDLDALTQDGSGQTLAVFELDGYYPTDVTTYEQQFNLRAVPLQNVLIDGFGGSPTSSGAVEVCLDIDLQIALSPDATEILVYEAPNTDTGVVDEYNQIATDDVASEVSTSWGMPEDESDPTTIASENTAFEQMATQGQSIYAAAGDDGAYGDGESLSVDDPASQPYMVGVGGTSLTTNGAGGSWASETTWNDLDEGYGAGGGGISELWPIPPWQVGNITTASLGSTTMRNVPDVSLDADPNTGYAIYDPTYLGGWAPVGGTSCAAPLWASFTSLVNQARLGKGKSTLGFANPSLYSIGAGGDYTADFHDIADGSTNGYYPAVTGYDLATGWGTYTGANLLSDLSGIQLPLTLSATAGNASVSLVWTIQSGATSFSVYRGTSSGGESTTPIESALTTTNYTDTGLSNGTTYYYTVTAMSAAGTVAQSNEASATPAVPPPGPTFTTLYTFTGATDGYAPMAALAEGANGTYYGLTANTDMYGDMSGYGSAYNITPQGVFTTLFQFDGTDGGNPSRGLLLGPDGNFYADTDEGGANSEGTDFTMTQAGTLTSLYSFSGDDGDLPCARLALGPDGNYYGETWTGGAYSEGNIYRMTPSGDVTSIYSFTGEADGSNPNFGLTLGPDGNFYGTTCFGGADSYGTVFRITTAGTLTTLYTFDGGTDGGNPYAALVVGNDGNLYGTAQWGGEDGFGLIYEMTTGGTFTPLSSFTSTNGEAPTTGLVQGDDGSFYGIALEGGTDDDGVVFSYSTANGIDVIHSFDYSDGEYPYSLTQGSDGFFYGTTWAGGTYDDGTVFKLGVQAIPAAPADLTATAAYTQVSLAWNRSTWATSYNVYRGTASGGEGATPVATVPGTTYSDTGVSNGSTYYYVVSAADALGTSANSNEVSASPLQSLPPGAPVLSASAGHAEVLLDWTATTSATTYCVYRGTATGGPSTEIVQNQAATTYLNTGLTNDVTYYYT
ncbi:MAG: choice-of-anchor tandem repeat GloVer-containing protein, partial [Capsulimonadaceae bacterium]